MGAALSEIFENPGDKYRVNFAQIPISYLFYFHEDIYTLPI
jgi:hypothetical protein